MLFALFVFALCLVYPMFSVFINCPFLIALSVFSNVYFTINTTKEKNRKITKNEEKDSLNEHKSHNPTSILRQSTGSFCTRELEGH